MSREKNQRVGISINEIRAFRDGKNTVKAINRYLSGVETAAVDTLGRREGTSPQLTRLYSETTPFVSLKQAEDTQKTQEIMRLRKEVEQQRTIIQLQDQLILKLMSKVQHQESPQNHSDSFPSNERLTTVCDKLRLVRELLQGLNE